MYKNIIRPIFFLFPPEFIHTILMNVFKIASGIPFVKNSTRPLCVYKCKHKMTRVFGIDFPNPVGMAAGFDKNAEVFEMLGIMGFGFVEIGTVTPERQKGNLKPRLFRLKNDQAIINRMGLNNLGLNSVITNLKKRKSDIIIGGNIGKNNSTPNEKASDDYAKCFEGLFHYVNYFVVNISCPNVDGVVKLQDKSHLSSILLKLQKINHTKPKEKPILLKISPDLNEQQLDDIIDLVSKTKIAGIVATNTSVFRDNLSYHDAFIKKIGKGGISGKPLRDKSTSIIKYISNKTSGSIPIIAVGGIMTAADAVEKIKAGASLVQIYSGFIYRGPALIKEINKVIKKI